MPTVVLDDGSVVISNESTFPVNAAAAVEVTVPVVVFPPLTSPNGNGRAVHPTFGAFDYEQKPDEWVNIDAPGIVIPPIWASARTLTSAANVLWRGYARDVIVEERWKAIGGLSMSVDQLRMFIAMYTNPVDPDAGYIEWYPNYASSLGYRVMLVGCRAGSEGITLDDVVNTKDEFGENAGWVTSPVTLQWKIAELIE